MESPRRNWLRRTSLLVLISMVGVAMAALGLKSSLRELATGGLRPLVVAGATTLVISSLAFGLALALPAAN